MEPGLLPAGMGPSGPEKVVAWAAAVEQRHQDGRVAEARDLKRIGTDSC